MDPVSVALAFAAVARAMPEFITAIKSIAETFAGEHDLDAAELVRAIDGDDHESVDSKVDAEIEAITWPTS